MQDAAYAKPLILGTCLLQVDLDFGKEPIGSGKDGKVYTSRISGQVMKNLQRSMFSKFIVLLSSMAELFNY